MRFKELSVALSMSVLFLCIPINSTISCAQVNKIYEDVNAGSSFKVKLTEEQLQSFNNFMERIPSVEDKNIAKNIADMMLLDDKYIDIHRFGEILREYGFENVSKYQETTDIIDDVLNFIMELIIERLGWVYDFLEKTSEVLRDAQQLWGDKSLPQEMITEIEILIENLNELQTLATLLIEGRYAQFLGAWNPGIIVEDIREIIESIEIIANDFGILAGDLSRCIGDISNLMNWLSDKPWEHPIHVYGKVMESAKGLSNVTIRCRGMTGTTDEEGNFSFFVNSTPDDHSIPPDVYYGIHQCIITVENKGKLKETPEEFSYVFSDGGIYWLFLIDHDSVCKENIQNVHLRCMGLWPWICLQNNKEIFRLCIMEKFLVGLTLDIT